jgi:hypothetical protein
MRDVQKNKWRKTMTASSYLQSAKIYQFPTGGRAALAGRRDETMPVENSVMPRIARVAAGGAWYHEEAVKADRARKM